MFTDPVHIHATLDSFDFGSDNFCLRTSKLNVSVVENSKNLVNWLSVASSARKEDFEIQFEVW